MFYISRKNWKTNETNKLKLVCVEQQIKRVQNYKYNYNRLQLHIRACETHVHLEPWLCATCTHFCMSARAERHLYIVHFM